MVAAAVELVFVSRHAIMECNFAGQAALGQQFQRAVHGGEADLGVFFTGEPEKLVRRKMVTGLKKSAQYGVALLGMFQSYALEMLIENLLGFAHVFTRRRSMIVNPSLQHLG